MRFSSRGNSRVSLINARNNYNELTSTIHDYMRLIVSIDKMDIRIEMAQYQMIRSSLFLVLYNLIESTMAILIRAVTDEINNNFISDTLKSMHLHDKIAKEVLKNIRADLETGESFYNYSLGICKNPNFKISEGGGGNWNYINIVAFSNKIGVKINMFDAFGRTCKRTVARRAKYVLDAEDPKIGSKTINSITDYRNKLAHGEVSFHKLTRDMTVNEMRAYALKTKMFLFYLIKRYELFISERQYLKQTENVA